jgi:hypothetical protein
MVLKQKGHKKVVGLFSSLKTSSVIHPTTPFLLHSFSCKGKPEQITKSKPQK